MSAGFMEPAPGPPQVAASGAVPQPHRGAAPWWWLGIVAVAFEAAFAVLLLWPMRIWTRPVSPHTHLVGTFGVNREGAFRYVVIVGLLFGLYALALWLVLGRRVRVPAAFVLGAAAVFYATLLLTHPLSSADVFNYIASARVQWTYGDNPLTTPPLAHPDDPFTRLLVFWKDLPSPYGPLWSILTAVPHALGADRVGQTVVAYKGMSILFFLTTAALAGAAAERLRPGSGAATALVLTWNPLAVWHVGGNGHNDAVMVCFLALAAYLLVRGWTGPAVLAFTTSALVKFATLLIVPVVLVWWWRSGRSPSFRSLLPWLGGAVLLAVAAYAPYWQGFDTFRTSLDEGTYFTVSGPASLRGALIRVMSVRAAETVTAWAVRLAFLAVYVALLRRLRGGSMERLIAGGALALVAYLTIAATYFAPWYVLWPLTLAAIVWWQRDALAPVLALSLGSMSVLLWVTWVRERLASDLRTDWYPVHLLAFLSMAPITLLAWWWARRGGTNAAPSPLADVHPPVLEREIARAGPES